MEDKTMKEKIDEVYEKLKDVEEKPKPIKMPRRGKLSKMKQRKGFITIVRVDDNGNIDFEKQKIVDSTFKLSNDTYHVLPDETPEKRSPILSYKGKPCLIQVSKRLNPFNPFDEKNETSGQKYLMARMLTDAIKIKSKGSGILLWVIVGVIIIGGIVYFTQGGA